MDAEIKFPALKFIGDQIMVVPIQFKGYMIGDEKMANYYFPTQILIIDAVGNTFNYKKVKALGNVQIIPSIRYAGFLYKLKPLLTEPVSKITLEDFKVKVIAFSSNKQTHSGLPKAELKAIQSAVKKANAHREVIEIIEKVSYWK